MQPTVRRLEISGLVQGVGFRWAMVEAARRLDVRGWVRNRGDGSVEAVIAGTPEAVDSMVVWARHGPAGARVQGVAVEPAEGRFDGFEQRPTA